MSESAFSSKSSQQVSRVMCHLIFIYFLDKQVELVGGGYQQGIPRLVFMRIENDN